MSDGKPATIHITIRRNSDGVTRVDHWSDWHAWRDGDDYWWGEGNMSCDCNREAMFTRAGAESSNDHHPCGDTAYSIVSITVDDCPDVVYRDADA